MIIKLFDNEAYGYPLIEIKDGHLGDFKRELDMYREKYPDDYGIDDFLAIADQNDWFIRAIYYDEEVFF